MSNAAPAAGGKQISSRRPRLLWANVYCLVDTSSGASMSVREMLTGLVGAGWDVDILGATNFDNERGTAGLKGHWLDLARRKGSIVNVQDGALVHRLYVTAKTRRREMTSFEEGAWFDHYCRALDSDPPDVVFYYGGQPFDMMIAYEAKMRGIPVAFYLANGNYHTARWCRDVGLVLTDSRATADLYRERLSLAPIAVGKFIDPARFVAPVRERQRVLFVNPLPEKGALLVARLALWLESRRPDIVFEVVESRGSWARIVDAVRLSIGAPQTVLDNVVLTANTDDMRPIYGRARVVLVPSLWWESGGRVIAEAMLNGIPVIATDCGGMAEMVGDGGILVRLPEKYHKRPYTLLPPEEEIEQIAGLVISLYDDIPLYNRLSACAHRVGEQTHGLAGNTQRLVRALLELIGDQAVTAN